MKFYCIGDEDTVRGFRLAGVEGRIVETPTETAAVLGEATNRDDVGVVILTSRLARAIPRVLEAIRLGRDYPLIVEIPGPEGAAPEDQGLRRMAQAAVGLNLGP